MKASGYSRLASSSRQYSGAYCLQSSYTAAFSARCSSVNVKVMSFMICLLRFIRAPAPPAQSRIFHGGGIGGGRRGPLRALAPFERGLALLVERAHALQTVLGRDRIVVRLDGQCHRRFEIGLAAP